MKSESYRKRIASYNKLIESLDKTINIFSYGRLVVFIVAAISAIVLFLKRQGSLFIFSLIASLLVFLILVHFHSKYFNKKKEVEALRDISDINFKRIEGKYIEFKDLGEEFKEEEHPYLDDLDIFGKGSLYQFLSMAMTPKGRECLGKSLKGEGNLSKDELLKKQKGILELSKANMFRERLHGKARVYEERLKHYKDLIDFGNSPSEELIKGSTIVLAFISGVTIISFILGFGLKKIPYFVPELLLILQLLILQINKKKRQEIFSIIGEQNKSLYAYKEIIKLIERRNYKSEILKEYKEGLKSNNKSMYEGMNELYNVSESLKNRQNAVYLVLNAFLLLDYHYYIKLNNIKKEYGKNLEKALGIIGHFEELSCYTSLISDLQGYSMASFTEERTLRGENIAHPLIGEKAVENYINLNNKSALWLITGSNMSGKSTYLRTIGINLVLAYSGAPVRSDNFICSKMNIYTCMRTGDNLEKSISSFYAEILKVKRVVEACKRGEEVFFLLDEIFKGTNSKDRHKGAEILISQLIKEKTLGLVSTHDLELSAMENINPRIKNYNFREYFENNEIKFDYKLRSGVSQTQNALYLMKMAGIEIE
ncbi:MutS family DNA mismatch repair protein [Clostridium hydrogeniformans]|uniref:MutS family DNA mismatch repair protein n=1 Tax=Clostridium hydrogeniformans TaxID=349933 RepID=UPI0004899294|nr:MutS family DNA mismatch repair protein [Clostridium hydrogeniformans]